ncbi:MAG: hypothetical protein ACSHWS_15820 [Sulfitobacter sp.]
MNNFSPMTDFTRSCVQASLKGVPVDHAVKLAALRSLTVLLDPVDVTENHSPYTPYSRLTPTGFPVEVAFGNPATEVRFATEVGGMAPLPEQRLALVAERFHDLGHIVDPILLDRCADLQQGQTLKYGAWASLRISAAAQAFKLYAEVPLAAHAEAIQDFHPPGDLAKVLTARGARVTMLGLPCDGEVEFYFGLNSMRLDELPDLYNKLGIPGGGDAVIKAIETVCGKFLNPAAKNRQNGLSLKQLHTGEWLMTVFCQADDLFGSGAQTRRALLKAAPLLGCDLSGYEAFSQLVADEVEDNRHCMLAFTPLPNGKVDLRVGLSPSPQDSAALDAVEMQPTTSDTDQPYYWDTSVNSRIIPDIISPRTL